jgi:hypothetical protein
LFQVVEDEEDPTLTEVIDKGVLDRAAGGRSDTDRLSDRAGDEIRVGDRREGDEPNAVGRIGAERGCRGEGQTRLADAGRTGEGQEADVRLTQEGQHRRQLLVATD